MRRIKARKKPRSEYKADGKKRIWFCGHCMSYQCDPMYCSAEMKAKMDRRREEGVHFACGNNPCTCKSRSGLKADIYV